MDILGLDPSLKNIVSNLRGGKRLTPGEAETLFGQAPLFLLSLLATEAKRNKSGAAVFYNKNFHIEPTNVCRYNCRFCSYRQPADSPKAWSLSVEAIREEVRRHYREGMTEVHLVGGVHPRYDLEFYRQMIAAVRELVPAEVSVKAFSAVEHIAVIEQAGLSYREGLELLRQSGMDTITGGGAEIFDPQVRMQIAPDKPDADQWLALHEAAHGLGMQTNATMLYGHVESVAQRIGHLERLRQLQERTGGFTAFIPLKYRSRNNALSHLGETSVIDDLKTLAIARLYLDNFPHIKAYWPMYGKKTTQLALLYGADDIDGTVADTTKIYSMAGMDDLTLDETELRRIVTEAGFVPVERDTFYREVKR